MGSPTPGLVTNGKLETTRYLCECTSLTIEDKRAVVQKGSPLSHPHILEYMLTQFPPILDQDILHAATQGNLEIVTRLFQSDDIPQEAKDNALIKATERRHAKVVQFLLTKNISQAAKDNALIKAAESRHKKIVQYLLTNEANLFAHQHVIDYVVAIGDLPSYTKEWLDSLSPQNKQMALEAHLKYRPLDPQFFQLIVDQIPNLTDTQLYPLLEKYAKITV